MVKSELPSYTAEIYRGWRIRKLYDRNDRGEMVVTAYYISNIKADVKHVAYDSIEKVREIIDEQLGDRESYKGDKWLLKPIRRARSPPIQR